jgi:hypothetical protein
MINCDHVGCDEMAAYYTHNPGYEKPFYLCAKHWISWTKDCVPIQLKEEK